MLEALSIQEFQTVLSTLTSWLSPKDREDLERLYALGRREAQEEKP